MYRKAARAGTTASVEGAGRGACTEMIARFSRYISAIEKSMASDVQLFYRHYPTHVCMDYIVIM